jgi:ribose transport system permease protein
MMTVQNSGLESPASLGEGLESPDLGTRLRTLLRGASLGRFSGFALWGLFILIFALWVPQTFLTGSTVKSILLSQSITAILAIAVVFPLAAGVFDLAAGQTLGFSALICGALMDEGPKMSPVTAIVITLVVSLLIGAFNGFIVSIVRVNSFIATLGTTSLLMGAASQIGNGQYIGPFSSGFTGITSRSPLGIPVVAFYLLILALVAWYVLEHTPIGRRLHATGANPESARLAGVRTTRYVFWSFVACGLGAGIAGVLLASSVNSVSETLGPSYLLPAYAGAFLGATQIKRGRFNIWGTLLAMALLGTGVQGLQLAGAQLYVTDYFNGAALIGAVSVVVILERRRGRRERKRTAAGLPRR